MKAPKKVMQSWFLARHIGAAAWLALATSASAAVLVYDGVPVSGTGAYNTGVMLSGQNPTNTSIIGETNAWLFSTGVEQVNSWGLQYPSGVQLSALGGSVSVTAGVGTVTTQGRFTRRSLLPALGGKSFYFSVLMAYNDISSYSTGAGVSWGLAQLPGSVSSSAKDAILVGFQKTDTGVNAVLTVSNITAVIQSGVLPGTHFVAGKFVYNADGADTIYASLNPGPTEPSSWATNVTVDLLSSTASFGYVNVGGCYGLNGNHVDFDEWRVGDTYSDVAGVSSRSGTAIMLR